MSKHEIEVEGLPDGYVAVAFRLPLKTEKYFFDGEIHTAFENMAHEYLIIKKKQPRRITFEETDCAGICDLDFSDGVRWTFFDGKYWCEVKETEEQKAEYVPNAGEYFRLEHRGNDMSYRSDIFLCKAAQKDCVTAEIVGGRARYGVQNFAATEWQFFAVSDEMLRANGIAKEEPKICLSVEECEEMVYNDYSIPVDLSVKIDNFLSAINKTS